MTAAVFVGAGGALLAGTLLCAGVAKLAVPAHLSRAIGELMPAARARAVPVTRSVAAVEVAAALALSVPAAAGAGAAAAVVLGALFAASGAVAAARGLRSPCGCFGRAGGRPLGARNVAYGLVLVALSAALLLDRSGGLVGHPGLPMVGAAAVALVLAGWVYRDMIKDLGPQIAWPRRDSATRSTG